MCTQKKKHQSTPNRSQNVTWKTQTTLRLPRSLYEQAKLVVEQQKTGSLNDFIVAALSAHVRALERKAIDDAFRGMAHDKQYQREALRVIKEFATSDGEAIELSESDLVGA